MKFLKFNNLFLPLALVGILATGLPFLGGSSVWLPGRWFGFALLAAYVIAKLGNFGSNNVGVSISWMVYISWCGATVGWSEAPGFTSLKAFGTALVAFAALVGGQQWVRTHHGSEALDFLMPWALLSLIAGLPGTGASEGFYLGSSGGPNFLGAAVAMSSPFLVFRLYQDRRKRRRMLVWAAALAAAVVLIYASNSRGSYLVFLGMSAGFLPTLRMSRAAFILTGVLWSLLILSVLAPDVAGGLYQRNILKTSGSASTSVTNSRDEIWKQSRDAASRGGWFGLGLGIAVGSDVKFLTSVFSTSFNLEYGREKGNSQFAIMEETGIIGLALYAVLHIVIFVSLVRGLRRATGEARIALGLIIGTMVGMFAHSFLEGWWTSPGSTEFGYFCAMAGAGLGLAGSRRQPSTEAQRLAQRLKRARAGRFVTSS